MIRQQPTYFFPCSWQYIDLKNKNEQIDALTQTHGHKFKHTLYTLANRGVVTVFLCSFFPWRSNSKILYCIGSVCSKRRRSYAITYQRCIETVTKRKMCIQMCVLGAPCAMYQNAYYSCSLLNAISYIDGVNKSNNRK